MLTIALLMGAANWIATTIIVESELTRPLREWVDRRAQPKRNLRHSAAFVLGYSGPSYKTVPRPVWAKVRYLVGCHLCTGTWVALAEACFVTLGLSSGLAGIVLSALVFKGVGHTLLNLNARLAP